MVEALFIEDNFYCVGGEENLLWCTRYADGNRCINDAGVECSE